MTNLDVLSFYLTSCLWSRNPSRTPYYIQLSCLLRLLLVVTVSHTLLFRDDLDSFGGFPGGSEVKESACNEGDVGSVPGFGRSPGEGNGNPLQYSCQENLMDGGAWWATVHGVAKSQTRLSDFTYLLTYISELKES